MNFPLTGMSRRFSIYFIHDLKQKEIKTGIHKKFNDGMEQNGNKEVKQKKYIALGLELRSIRKRVSHSKACGYDNSMSNISN